MSRIVLLLSMLYITLPLHGSAQSAAVGTASNSLPQAEVVIEADTYVPMFYKGRAEPTRGSTVRAIAVVSGIGDPENYNYQWEVAGEVIGGGPLTGQNVVTFKTPIGDTFIVRLTVTTPAGQRVASAYKYVSVSEPELHFYEDSVLRGTTEVVVPETYVLVGDEVRIRAVPYFMDREIFAGEYEASWEVNGDDVTDLADNPQVITLRRVEGSGEFAIEYTLQNLRALTARVASSFTLTF